MKTNLNQINNISSYDYYRFYLKNSRLISIVWIILSICFTISLVIAFASPNWVGDTLQSSNRGFFGLYRFCIRNRLGNSYRCFGTWTDFSTLPNSPALRASCFLIGFSCLVSIVCLLVTFLCLIIKYERIFHICAWIQFTCRKFIAF